MRNGLAGMVFDETRDKSEVDHEVPYSNLRLTDSIVMTIGNCGKA